MSRRKSSTTVTFAIAGVIAVLASFAYAATTLTTQYIDEANDLAYTQRLRGLNDQPSPDHALTETYKLARNTRQYALDGHGLTEKDVETLACFGCFRISVSFLHDSETSLGGMDRTTLTAYFYENQLQKSVTETKTVEVGPLMSCDPEPTKPVTPMPDSGVNRDPGGNVGAACQADADCQTPFSYLVQSNCPYGSKCVEDECRVVCPVFPDAKKSGSCQTDDDCALCNETHPHEGATCKCLDNRCHQVEPKDGP